MFNWDPQLLQRLEDDSVLASSSESSIAFVLGVISPAAAHDEQFLNRFMQKFTVGQFYFWIWQ